MKTIVLASNNSHKIKEFKQILPSFNIVSLKEIGFFDEIIEDGTTFKENSLIKAKTIFDYLVQKGNPCYVIADDSGLSVDALGGAPDIYSARYSGDHDDQKNRDTLLKNLTGINNRSAHFNCTITLITPSGKVHQFEGKTFGEITYEEKGDTSFGYDSLFYSIDLNKTFGEATSEEKNSVSHRARALKELVETLSF